MYHYVSRILWEKMVFATLPSKRTHLNQAITEERMRPGLRAKARSATPSVHRRCRQIALAVAALEGRDDRRAAPLSPWVLGFRSVHPAQWC